MVLEAGEKVGVRWNRIRLATNEATAVERLCNGNAQRLAAPIVFPLTSPRVASLPSLPLPSRPQDPDDTLKLKTLELLYKMTKANNIQVGAWSGQSQREPIYQVSLHPARSPSAGIPLAPPRHCTARPGWGGVGMQLYRHGARTRATGVTVGSCLTP